MVGLFLVNAEAEFNFEEPRWPPALKALVLPTCSTQMDDITR